MRLDDKHRKLARENFWKRHDRDEYSCPDCGRKEDEVGGVFEVHHINGEPRDNRPENHVALCRLCHNIREDKKPPMELIKNLRDQPSTDSSTKKILNGPQPGTCSDCGEGIRKCGVCGEPVVQSAWLKNGSWAWEPAQNVVGDGDMICAEYSDNRVWIYSHATERRACACD